MHRHGRRVTIVEVAAAAGVSPATVSVVLNDRASAVRISETTRAAVRAAAEQLGYRPNSTAQNLRRQRSTTLTLLTGSLSNPFFVDVAAGVRLNAAQHGYELHVVDGANLEAELHALDQLRNGSSAGVIVATGRHGARGPAIDALQQLVRAGLPAVIVTDRSPDPAIPTIRIDDVAEAFAATNHLLRLGHRRIAHLTARHSSLASDEQSVEADRFAGYRQALNEAKHTFDPAWLVQGEATMQGGYTMMRELLARAGARPSAVFCVNDLLAIGALRALYEARIDVPGEMAVMGFDGIALGRFTTPTLTTMEQPRVTIGQRAADMLLGQLDGAAVTPGEQVLQATLIVRESCGAAAASRPRSGRSGRQSPPERP